MVAETYPVMWHATGVSGDGEVSPVRHVEGRSMVWKDGRVWAKAWRQKKFSGWSVMPRAVKRGRPQAQS